MKASASFLAGVLLLSIQIGGGGTVAGSEQVSVPASAGIAEQLRYIGRDGLTGLPARVNEAVIGETERAFARYGKDEQQAIPPPPVAGIDVARLAIPAIAVDADVNRFGVDRFGRLDVPQDGITVGWNPAFTDLPGSGGETFLAAHFEYLGRPGVFFRLSALVPGDTVTVTLTDGSSHRYRVTSVVDYPLAAIDMGALLFGREGREGITLMTCSGPANEGEYPSRTVVLAERIPGSP